MRRVRSNTSIYLNSIDSGIHPDLVISKQQTETVSGNGVGPDKRTLGGPVKAPVAQGLHRQHQGTGLPQLIAVSFPFVH